MRNQNLILLFTLMMFISFSCSRAGNPVSPADSNEQNPASADQTSKSTLTYDDNYYRGVMGAWEVVVDTGKMSAEITPARNAKAIGHIFDADLSQFLTVAPCADCLQIVGLKYGYDKYFDLDIAIRHPFGNINTRPDLHGFDVRAIFLNPVTPFEVSPFTVTKPDGTEETAGIDAWSILNPDGFTSHYDELINDTRYFIHGEDCPSNLNPFIRFFDNFGMGTFDPHAPSGYNVMPVGSDVDIKTAVFATAPYDNIFRFFIVADVAYGQSAVLANRTNPHYFLPSFNRTEPWRVEYYIENNNLSSADPNATADVVVQVFDWQHAASVDPNYPDPANLTGLKESSKVSEVILYFPDLKTDPWVLTTPESGDGTPANPLIYRFVIKNELSFENIWYFGYICVRDELNGKASPEGRLPVPESPSGFPYSTLDIRDYSYYGAVRVNNPNPSYSYYHINEIRPDPSSQYMDNWYGGRVMASHYIDESHHKYTYEWDYNYDGVTFTADATGLPTPYISGSTLTPGVWNFGLRVTNPTSPPRQDIYQIPVYAEGEEYNKAISSNTEDTTSRQGSAAVYATADLFYVAFLSNRTGQWNIFLAAFEREHTVPVDVIQITNATTESYYDPALAVIEDGPNQGIYILFTKRLSGFENICSIRGNLDLTGFDAANIKKVTDSPTWYSSPSIVATGTTLYAYFVHHQMVPTFYYRVEKAESTDFGQTWTNIIQLDDTSDYQYNPAVSLSPDADNVYIIWEDGRNSADFGLDLYLCDDYFTGSWAIQLTKYQAYTDEYSPAIARDDYSAAIAFLSRKVGETDSDLKLMVWTGSTNVHDYTVSMGSGYHLKNANPAIAMPVQGKYIVSVPQYNMDSNEFENWIYKLSEDPDYPFLEWETIEDSTNLGTVDVGGSESYPGLFCRSVANGYAIECFEVTRCFNDGNAKDTSPFDMYFGQIRARCYIVEGKED
jgi:hypothetical protein